mmetsp:Transcript_44767/g.115845  ORF Transcript_44767/g.115845 Transcript_44767/m.115845 type:complete len:240 (-) Transcript_44767:277-996(-)
MLPPSPRMWPSLGAGTSIFRVQLSCDIELCDWIAFRMCCTASWRVAVGPLTTTIRSPGHCGVLSVCSTSTFTPKDSLTAFRLPPCLPITRPTVCSGTRKRVSGSGSSVPSSSRLRFASGMPGMPGRPGRPCMPGTPRADSMFMAGAPRLLPFVALGSIGTSRRTLWICRSASMTLMSGPSMLQGRMPSTSLSGSMQCAPLDSRIELMTLPPLPMTAPQASLRISMVMANATGSGCPAAT